MSLLNLPYADALKMLQNTGRTVELVVSQIFNKQPNSDNNKWINSTSNSYANYSDGYNSKSSLKKIFINSPNHMQSTDNGFKKSQRNVDYLKHIRYDTDEASFRHEENYIIPNGYQNIARDSCATRAMKKIDDSNLVSAKSMPDLPKVSSFIIYFFRF